MKIIKIVNNSRGSLQIDYPGGKLAIPGHCFEADPFCAEVPDEVVDHIVAKVTQQPAYVYMRSDIETIETPDDDADNDSCSDDDIKKPEDSIKTPPEKDEFIARCSAKAVEGQPSTYEVTLPAGDVMTVTGVHHHMQAKSEAYTRLYGGSE